MDWSDRTEQIWSSYRNGRFDLEAWKGWMQEALPHVGECCLLDLEESLAKGLSWEEDFLPVLNALPEKQELLRRAQTSFAEVVTGLEETVVRRFGRCPDAEIILYPGLCNGAGWVTGAAGKTLILLGIEKIVELDWCGVDDMNGLIVHELGHVYQMQFGLWDPEAFSAEERFLWQLFTEGVAMVFEQEVAGDPDYFHQDRNGWKDWCGAHIRLLAEDFARDLPRMTDADQRYFGDWVRYEGQPDAGYYLGARMVRHALRRTPFDELIRWTIGDVRNAFREFRDALDRQKSTERTPDDGTV